MGIRLGVGRLPNLPRRSWIALALASTAMFASAPGQSFLMAVFLDDMLTGTDVSRTAFSALYGVATIASATMSFWLGRGADRFGLRLAWVFVAAGLAGACLVASFATGAVSVLLALSLLRAFGQGSFPLLGVLIANYRFVRRPGAAVSVARFGITAAIVVLPPLVALLIDGVGWRSAYRVLGAVVLVAVLPLAFLLRDLPPRMGTRPVAHRAERPLSASRRSRRLRIRIPRREAALLLFVSSAAPLVLTAITFHAVSLLSGHGLSVPAAAVALSLFGIASAAATIGLGPFSDRLTTRSLLTGTSGILLLATLVLFVPSPAPSYLAFGLLGVAGSLSGVTTGVVWSRTYGLARLGRLQGVSSAAAITAAAAGPLPLALSVQLTDGYGAGLVFLAIVAATTLVVATRWRDPLPHMS